MLRIALDAMGGDHAPAPIVAGAIQALAADPEIVIVLVGDQSTIQALIPADAPIDRLEIFHASQVVGMDESPVEALRAKPDNTISRLWQLMVGKKVDAIVSAGSTGAMVAGGLFSRRFLKHVKRPGIATVMPTAKGPCIILDVGANVHPKPGHLYQYGVMGAIYARHMLGKENPTVGLMNVGEEEGKGHELAQKAYSLLKDGLKERFIGNIEGRDIHRGACDVVVTDGFVGNVVLKLAEGVFDFLMKTVAKEIIPALPNDQAVAMGALKALISKYDYSTVGGAALMGIDGICIICHGSSKDVAIRNALALAARNARQKINEKIVKELDTLPRVDEEDS
ncbi:phosphate acyltransferase PlsX [Zavarzinella formosa]|uniref:phosphate acyltransferase PlsX n=1 Tax=Zavarzinella formosa TaxID=360055 RepID=UPI0002E9063B|nr:phosphate acyltransferase PlsX [Zavarzinella formosa]